MVTTRTVSCFVFIASIVVFTPACDRPRNSDLGTPTGPSTSFPISPGTATIAGTLTAVSSTSPDLLLPRTLITVLINVTGTGIFATASPGGNFVLNGVPAGDIELHFVGPGIDAKAIVGQVQNGDEIHVVVSVHGLRATLERRT